MLNGKENFRDFSRVDDALVQNTPVCLDSKRITDPESKRSQLRCLCSGNAKRLYREQKYTSLRLRKHLKLN